MGCKDDVNGVDFLRREEVPSERKTVFEVKVIVLHYLQSFTVCHSDFANEGLAAHLICMISNLRLAERFTARGDVGLCTAQWRSYITRANKERFRTVP